MTFPRWSLVALLGVLLSGCAQYTLVKPGQVTVADTMRVQSGIDWSRRTTGSKELWTVDGSGLNEVVFLMAIANDQPILADPSDKKAAKYKEGMTSLEIAEAIEASFVSGGITNYKVHDLRPYKVGGIDGFRFEFAYTIKEGLDKLGIVVGAVRNKTLNVIMYDAPRIHFYEKYRGEVESIVNSAKFI